MGTTKNDNGADSTTLSDSLNRIALGESALALSVCVMFTGLAAHTQQDRPATTFAIGLGVQTLLAAGGVWRWMKKKPSALFGPLARMAAVPLALAATIEIADLQDTPAEPLKTAMPVTSPRP